MITLKTSKELALMKEAGILSARALQLAGNAVEPGVSTAQIDKIAHDFIVKNGAEPAFLGFHGFPATACISINHEVIHGIPRKDRILKAGDLVKIDLGAKLNGYFGDTAATFAVGDISPEAKRLSDTTRESLQRAIQAAVAGGRIGDIGHAVSGFCEEKGYRAVRDFTGHGIGKEMHEDPSVPNFGIPAKGLRLMPGMTLAIEPMINAGKSKVQLLPDGWTVVTCDGSLSAHFEHTVAITTDGPVILTDPAA